MSKPLLITALAVLVVATAVFSLMDHRIHTDSAATTPSPVATATSSPVPSISPAASSAAVSPTPAPSPLPTEPADTSSYASSTASAQQAYSLKDYPQAQSLYQRAYSQAATDDEKALAQNGIANTLAAQGVAGQAVTSYKMAITLDKSLGDTYLNLAALYWQLKDKDNATATLQQGLDATATRADEISNALDVYKRLTP